MLNSRGGRNFIIVVRDFNVIVLLVDEIFGLKDY